MALLQTLLFLLLYIQNNAFNPYNMFNDDVNNDLTLNNNTNYNTYALFNADVDANLTQNTNAKMIPTMPWARSQAINDGYDNQDCFVDCFGDSDTHSPQKNAIPNQDCFVECLGDSDTHNQHKNAIPTMPWTGVRQSMMKANANNTNDTNDTNDALDAESGNHTRPQSRHKHKHSRPFPLSIQTAQTHTAQTKTAQAKAHYHAQSSMLYSDLRLHNQPMNDGYFYYVLLSF